MDFTIPKARFVKLIGVELEGGWKPSRGITPYGDGSVANVQLRCENRSSCTGCDACAVARPTIADYNRYIGLCGRAACTTLEWSDPARCQWCRSMFSAHRLTVERDIGQQRGRLFTGEIASPPLPVKEGIEWVVENYPDAMNETCGMHIHSSFGSVLRYAQLMDPPFWDYYRDQMSSWAAANLPEDSPFWPRWKGKNTYCRDRFIPDLQAQERHKGEARYSNLNFCYSVGGVGHGHTPRQQQDGINKPRKTLECRVFPVFTDKTVAAAALCRYIDIIESFLKAGVKIKRGSQKIIKEAVISLDMEVLEERPELVRYA